MAGHPYKVRYAKEAIEDIQSLRAYDRGKIFAAIERHLFHDPLRVSRTQIKRMLQPFWSQFRLRVQDFRVYYDVDEPQRIVDILRILKKEVGQTLQEPPHETNRNNA